MNTGKLELVEISSKTKMLTMSGWQQFQKNATKVKGAEGSAVQLRECQAMATTNLNISVIDKRMPKQSEAASYAGLPVKHFEAACPVRPVGVATRCTSLGSPGPRPLD